MRRGPQRWHPASEWVALLIGCYHFSSFNSPRRMPHSRFSVSSPRLELEPFRSDKPRSLRFSYHVRDLGVWQKILLCVAAVGALWMMGLIGREIFFAVNPDKRPRKRKRRSSDDDLPK